MIFLNRMFFILIITFSAFYSLAQEDFEDLGYFESEDIACEDLPEAFDKYQQDVQLSQISLQKALSSTAQFLKKTVQEGGLVDNSFLQMIEDLEQVSLLSMDNSATLSNRAYDISYFLSDCLDSSQE